MKRIAGFFWREKMLTLSLLAAAVALTITPFTPARLMEIDWRTLGNLMMMLCVLEGVKQENLLRPVEALAARLKTMPALAIFLIFGVFFSSMFVTNDVSLIIFVPLTIQLFRQGGKERYLLPVISMENIAAVRGSLLTPFGSPQNLFLYGQLEISAGRFILHMLPLCVLSAGLLVGFVFFLFRKNVREPAVCSPEKGAERSRGKARRRIYGALFALVIAVIVSRTRLWPAALAAVVSVVALTDRSLLKKVDYVLLATFLCFFVFSSSVAAHPQIAALLKRAVAGHEYFWSIGLSQIISNVPATIVLYPFTENVSGLIYGADTAGLCSIIGSLASVINYRIYVREYPGDGKNFLRVFTLTSWAFFVLVAFPGYLLCLWPFR